MILSQLRAMGKRNSRAATAPGAQKPASRSRDASKGALLERRKFLPPSGKKPTPGVKIPNPSGRKNGSFGRPKAFAYLPSPAFSTTRAPTGERRKEAERGGIRLAPPQGSVAIGGA
jgi:hypothetical protein